MKYVYLLISLFIFIVHPTLASESEQLPEWKAMTTKVLKHPMVKWDKYREPKYHTDHMEVMEWLAKLGRKKELHNFAYQYQQTKGLKLGILEQDLFGFSTNMLAQALGNYVQVINISQQNSRNLPQEIDWEKPPYNLKRGPLKKYNLWVTYVAPAYIDIKKQEESKK